MVQDNTPNDELQQLAELDRFIHEPARLLILGLLSVVESADFIFVMKQTGLTRGNLSVHMSKLEDAGYILVQKEFVERTPRTLMSITAEGQQAFDSYRRSMLSALSNLGA
jgi:DNA-binding transcriptional ArsR family regulator